MHKKRKSFTFEDILKDGDYTICDSSITSPLEIDWYWGGVYHARNFSQINLEYVATETHYLESFLELLSNPKVYVAPSVPSEIRTAREIVADKMRYLKKEEKKEIKKRKRGKGNNVNTLQEVHDLFHECFNATKRVSFSPKRKKDYDILERIVMNVTEKTGAKIDLDYFYEQRAKPKRVGDSHADEQGVAIALYLSIFENKTGSILTGESDMERILENTISYFYHSKKYDINKLWGITKQNAIKIFYFPELNKAELTFDSRHFPPSQEIPRETFAGIDNQIVFT